METLGTLVTRKELETEVQEPVGPPEMEVEGPPEVKGGKGLGEYPAGLAKVRRGRRGEWTVEDLYAVAEALYGPEQGVEVVLGKAVSREGVQVRLRVGGVERISVESTVAGALKELAKVLVGQLQGLLKRAETDLLEYTAACGSDELALEAWAKVQRGKLEEMEGRQRARISQVYDAGLRERREMVKLLDGLVKVLDESPVKPLLQDLDLSSL